MKLRETSTLATSFFYAHSEIHRARYCYRSGKPQRHRLAYLEAVRVDGAPADAVVALLHLRACVRSEPVRTRLAQPRSLHPWRQTPTPTPHLRQRQPRVRRASL
jgi:hypothetical protein